MTSWRRRCSPSRRYAYPELSREDVVAALDYASAVVDEEKVVALGA